MKKKDVSLTLATCLLLSLSTWSCKPSPSGSSENQWIFGGGVAGDVTGKRTCSDSKFTYVDSGDMPTTVYHWTKSEDALRDPKRYLVTILREGLKANDAGHWAGVAGNGVYLAMDPYQSAQYGPFLIQFDIAPHSKFPLLRTGQAKEAYAAKCPGGLYKFAPGLLESPESPLMDAQALVIWDLASVVPASIRAFSGAASSGRPGIDVLTRHVAVQRSWIGMKDVYVGESPNEKVVSERGRLMLRDDLVNCYHKSPKIQKLGVVEAWKQALDLATSLETFLDYHDAANASPEVQAKVKEAWAMCAGSVQGSPGTTNVSAISDFMKNWRPADYDARAQQQTIFWKNELEYWGKLPSIRKWKK